MRTKIALRNLYISQAIILLFLIFAYLVWFPHSFSQLGGFFKTALMLVFVDLVLGPFLVFIVFKEDKRYLKFDINVLLAIQITAFIFGAYSLFLMHPAYVVFNNDRFHLTNVSHTYPQKHWFSQLKSSFFSTPSLVFAKPPESSKKQFQLAIDVDLQGLPDIDRRPEYYEPFKAHIDSIFAKSIPINTLIQNNKTKEKLAIFYKEHGGKPDDYAYFPLVGNNKKDMIWVFKRSTAQAIGIVDSDPWQIANK